MSVPRDFRRKKIVEKALKDLEPGLRESAEEIFGERREAEKLKKSKRNELGA